MPGRGLNSKMLSTNRRVSRVVDPSHIDVKPEVLRFADVSNFFEFVKAAKDCGAGRGVDVEGLLALQL